MKIDKRHTVAITVSGGAGSGKSTVAAAIHKALLDYGCQDVTLNEEFEEDASRAWARMEENIEAVEGILSETTVIINVVQTIRDKGA